MPVIVAAIVMILILGLFFVRRATRAGEPAESIEGRSVGADEDRLERDEKP